MANPYLQQRHESGIPWVEKAAEIAKKVLQRHAAEVDGNARFPSESIQALGEAGFFGLCLPKAFGGQAQPPAVFAAVVEELAQACASTAMVYVMHVSASQVIAVSDAFADKQKILTDICQGKHLTTLAFSETGSRSQFWSPCSKFAKQGSGFVTSAKKSWVTSADNAHSYVSSAQKAGAGSPMESVLYFVRRGAKGMQTVGSFNGLGLRGNGSAPVSLEGVAVPPGDLLTKEGDGARVMLEVVLPWFIVGTSAMANGLCLTTVGMTAGHLAQAGFESGAKLRDLPTLRARLAQMTCRTQTARALLGWTAGMMESPAADTPLFALQSRAASLEAALEVTDLGMKACGGAAFSKQLPLERCFRDARAGWVMAPTVDHLNDFIGRAMTGLPLF